MANNNNELRDKTNINKVRNDHTSVNNHRNNTDINSVTERESTSINTLPNRNATDINTNQEINIINLQSGDHLSNYVIKASVNESGEAKLYSASDSKNETCMIKVFKREMDEDEVAAHQEIIEKLRSIPRGVVNILETGIIDNHIYNVMPFYKNGSLADRIKNKLFTEQELEKEIIPRLNKIIKSIHDKGVYHADIKPENIMYDENKRDLVLIDFGVSVKTSEGQRTVVKTTIGGTTDYRAIETYSGGILPESDYYSLGITLYTLMYGAPPSAHLKEEDVQRWKIFGGAIPKPDKMSDRMHTLLKGLTYASLANRDDRTNPHVIRWLFNEVEMWLKGGWPPKQVAYSDEPNRKLEIPKFNIRFGGSNYSSIVELIYALLGDWERGKNFVFRDDSNGLVSIIAKAARSNEKLIPFENEISGYIRLLTDCHISQDAGLFEFAYKYGNGIDVLFWKGMTYQDIDSLGRAIFDSLENESVSNNTFYELLSQNLLIKFIKQKPQITTREEALLKKIESIPTTDPIDLALYKLAFLMVEDKSLKYSRSKPGLNSIAELKKLLSDEGMKRDLSSMGEFCKSFMDANGKVNSRYKAWEWFHSSK